MSLIHNLGLVTLCGIISAFVLAAELVICDKIDKRYKKDGRAQARPQ